METRHAPLVMELPSPESLKKVVKTIAYQTDKDGVFIGIVSRQKSPLEPEQYLLPMRAVEIEPPPLTGEQKAVWDGNQWKVQDSIVK